MAREAKDIKEKVLWVIESRANEKSGGGTDLRVVQWLVNGKPTKPGLEKREWYNDQEGDRKLGKAKAFNSYDLAAIILNIKKIAKLVELNADKLDEALQLAMYQDENATASAPKPSSASSTRKPSSEPVASGAPPAQSF
jgi:hypothetical protein